MTDHYKLLCDRWAERIAGLSQNELQTKLPELHSLNNGLTLWHFDRQIYIDFSNGQLKCISDSNSLSINEMLNIYTLLWYCKDTASLSGQWLPFRSMKGATPFAPAFEKNVLQSFSATFNGKESLLKTAVTRIGGSQINANSYYVPAFACMPLRIQFWDGDDEFSAQGNILFDKNATDFIHIESLVTIASQCVVRLRSAVELSATHPSYEP